MVPIVLSINFNICFGCSKNETCYGNEIISKTNLNPTPVARAVFHAKSAVYLLRIHYLLLLPLFRGFVLGLCFDMQYIVCYLDLQLSRFGRESQLFCLYCLFDGIWLLAFFASSS